MQGTVASFGGMYRLGLLYKAFGQGDRGNVFSVGVMVSRVLK